jgi:hypothetical protein
MTTTMTTTMTASSERSGSAAAGTGSVQKLTTLTNATTTATKPTAGRKIAKWSGDDEPSEFRRWGEDTDTGRLTVGEQRRIQCYHANAQRKWRNADEENDARVVAAAKAIVREIASDHANAQKKWRDSDTDK